MMNDSTDMRSARIAMESTAHAVASELIEAQEHMTDDEIHHTTVLMRSVHEILDDLLNDVLEYGERADEG